MASTTIACFGLTTRANPVISLVYSDVHCLDDLASFVEQFTACFNVVSACFRLFRSRTTTVNMVTTATESGNVEAIPEFPAIYTYALRLSNFSLHTYTPITFELATPFALILLYYISFQIKALSHVFLFASFNAGLTCKLSMHSLSESIKLSVKPIHNPAITYVTCQKCCNYTCTSTIEVLPLVGRNTSKVTQRSDS